MGLRRCALELAYPASKASTVCIFSTPRSVRSRWELDTLGAMVEYVEIGTLQTRLLTPRATLAY